MILKNLLRRKVRTLLTLLGIAIGVAAVVALGALGEGFKSGYGSMASGSNTDLLVLQKDAIDISLSAVAQDLKPVLAGQRGVMAISEMIYTFAASDNVPYFIAYGYDPAGFAIQKFKIIAGESLSTQRDVRGGRPLLLGKAVADDLDRQVGDTFRLYGTLFRIVGIYETGAPFEDGGAVLTLEDAQILSGKPHQVNAFLLQLRPGTDIEALSAHIEKRFDKLTTTTSANFAEDQDMFKYIDAYVWAISLVAVLIGGVGVMNTIMMSVVERTREIGVLRAVGWRRRQVLKMVIGESFVLSFLGGALGVGLGLGIVSALEGIPTLSAMLPGTFSFALYARGMGVALGLGLVGGALPAWRASQLTPADAMRSESSSVKIASWVKSAALRNILRQPTRTLLTLVGIAMALMAMILMGALSAGMINLLENMMGGGGADLLGIEADASIDLSKIDAGDVHRLTQLPGVEEAEGFLTGYTVVGDLPFFVAFGYAPRGLAIRKFKVVEGDSLQTNHQ
ncbi:MAG: ABC transporter permease, partial [Chloroflexota bacterium]|nr:ABC transporter permease [Chloroflexota bacterium]